MGFSTVSSYNYVGVAEIILAERIFRELGITDTEKNYNDWKSEMERVIIKDLDLHLLLSKAEITYYYGEDYIETTRTLDKEIRDFMDRSIKSIPVYGKGLPYDYKTGRSGHGTSRDDGEDSHWFRSGFYYRDFLEYQLKPVMDNEQELRSRISEYLGSYIDEIMLIRLNQNIIFPKRSTRTDN